MNRHVGEESASRVREILVDLFASGYKATFADLRRKVEEVLGHRVHSSFVARPLAELQRESIATCRYETGTHLWQVTQNLCTWCGSSEGQRRAGCSECASL